jgi:hypothetical protein
VALALVCCGGPLLAAALVATGAGAWFAAHGVLLGAVALLALAALIAGSLVLHGSRQ